MTADNVLSAEVELACADLHAALEAFDRLGFALLMIVPADDPQTAVVTGHGVRLRLTRDPRREPGVLRLVCREALPAIDAGGIRIERVGENALAIPPAVPSFTVTRADPGAWQLGRAGMQYRDLIPGRYGGRFIASHIRIPDGGPVADYVHFHAIRFQLIYCYKGWVRLVYEDRGEPFVMKAGECVMQPPRIRHRVLESSPGLEVVEITCPATHETYRDHELALPTPVRNRTYDDGQRFTHGALLGVAPASGGLAGARLVERGGLTPAPSTHDAELLFGFVLDGTLTVACGGVRETLVATDAFTIPPVTPFELGASPDLALLEVTLPAQVAYAPVR